VTVTIYNNEVELSFDNSTESGYLNFETNGVRGEMVNFDFSVGKSDSEYVDVEHSSSLDKQELIEFLEKSLEILKKGE
jgi:hypothetical protein